jgi:hypothetical protein
MPHFTMLYHAAMAGRSSLRAAVIQHTRSRAASFSVITGPDWHTPAQVTRSSPPHQEKTSTNSSLAQSDDADRSLSAVDTSSLRHPHRLCDQLSIPEKVGSGLSKRPPYSRVQRCRQLHAAITHSGGSRPWSVHHTATFTPVGWPEGVSPSGSHRVKWAAGEVPAVRVLFRRPLPEPAERVSP